jgi:hypothetical protein
MKYFLHDSSAFQDEKVTKLFMEYGYEGLGLFYTILEKIALQEKPINTAVLKKQLFVGKKLEKCWQFMEEIGVISSKNGETFNERILSYSETYQVKKEKNRERISQWRDKQDDVKNVTCNESVRNTPKVKRSKVNINKDIREGVVYPFEGPEFLVNWKLWKDYKKTQFKFEYKSTQSEQAALNELAKMAKSESMAILIIAQSMAKGWKGLFEIKNIDNGQSNLNGTGTSKKQLDADAAAAWLNLGRKEN